MRREQRRLLAYEVQRLDRAGRSQREIARTLGVARKTVRKLLRELEQRRREGESAPERLIQPRVPKPSKLDRFEDKILEWLKAEQKDENKKKRKLTAVRCFEKLQDEGFEGGYTIVRERFKKLRQQVVPPRPTATPVETAPGQRAEFDWSPYDLTDELKVQLWNASLRWSRAPSMAAARNTRQTTTLRFLREAFEEWEGVPEECLTDSMPGVVDRWECEEPVLNARYVDFAAHYGYTALIAPRGCPQWKAIAERLFRFHEDNLLSGRTFRNFEEYVALLEWWRQKKKLDRPHPETERPIREMLELERPHLQPLPRRPYDTRDVVVRVIDDYQRVRFETNHYPVPAPVGSRVYVCADAERVEVCDHQARRLIEHERLLDGARIKLTPPHVRRVRYDLDELVERLARWGEVAADFAGGVRQRRRYAGPELVRLLQLQVDWSVDDLVVAMQHARTYHCYEVSKVLRILESRFSPRRLEDRLAESSRRRIQEVMKAHPVSQRPLSSYETLRTGDRPVERTDEDEGKDEKDENEPSQS